MNIPDRPEWDDRDEITYRLVMPFTEVRSEGGPYDDLSFVAGFQMGQIDGKLTSMGQNSIAAATFLVFSQLKHQVDLIAMKHNYTSEVLHDDGEWAQIGVTRV